MSTASVTGIRQLNPQRLFHWMKKKVGKLRGGEVRQATPSSTQVSWNARSNWLQKALYKMGVMKRPEVKFVAHADKLVGYRAFLGMKLDDLNKLNNKDLRQYIPFIEHRLYDDVEPLYDIAAYKELLEKAKAQPAKDQSKGEPVKEVKTRDNYYDPFYGHIPSAMQQGRSAKSLRKQLLASGQATNDERVTGLNGVGMSRRSSLASIQLSDDDGESDLDKPNQSRRSSLVSSQSSDNSGSVESLDELSVMPQKRLMKDVRRQRFIESQPKNNDASQPKNNDDGESNLDNHTNQSRKPSLVSSQSTNDDNESVTSLDRAGMSRRSSVGSTASTADDVGTNVVDDGGIVGNAEDDSAKVLSVEDLLRPLDVHIEFNADRVDWGKVEDILDRSLSSGGEIRDLSKLFEVVAALDEYYVHDSDNRSKFKSCRQKVLDRELPEGMSYSHLLDIAVQVGGDGSGNFVFAYALINSKVDVKEVIKNPSDIRMLGHMLPPYNLKKYISSDKAWFSQFAKKHSLGKLGSQFKTLVGLVDGSIHYGQIAQDEQTSFYYEYTGSRKAPVRSKWGD